MEDDLNIDDIRAAHAFWVLLQQQKREVRELLASKLNESLKAGKPSTVAEHPKTDESSKKEDRPKKPLLPSKEAMEFVSSLSVQGGEEVPPDERGIFALLDEKYRQ